ncbi:MAG: transposase, partial [Planctomycetota bacterium]
MTKHSCEPSLFKGIFHKPVVSQFDSELRTSDGGASLLGAVDRRINLTETLSELLGDPRDPARTEHSHLELFRQRVFSIALGYPDGNDSARIGGDPMLKLICGRKPADGGALASQPTLSRFEHGIAGRDLISLGRGLEDFVIKRLRHRHRRARVITVDLDGTVDPTH